MRLCKLQNTSPGDRFGRLKVLGAAFYLPRGNQKDAYLVCLCDCGQIAVTRRVQVRSGKARSCGCLHLETNATNNLRHGGCGSPLYVIWQDMKRRCLAESEAAYAVYGADGIGICREWAGSFTAFRDWAKSSGYQDGMTIDRRDSNLGYDPTNCRWATRLQQVQNRRKTRRAKGSYGSTSRFKGVSWSNSRQHWIANINVRKRRIYLGSFGGEYQAAEAYDAAARVHFGEFACLNFPQNGESPALQFASPREEENQRPWFRQQVEPGLRAPPKVVQAN